MFKSFKSIVVAVILVLLLVLDKNLLLIVNLIALFYFFLKGKINKEIKILILFLFIPIILSGIHGLFFYPLYDVFKDIYYLLNPVMFFVLGVIMAQKVGIKLLFRSVVIVGTLYSIFHIIQVFSIFGFSAFYDFRLVRNEEGGGNIITVIALVLSLFSIYLYKLKLFKSALFKKIFIILNGLSFLFAASRTFLIIFFVMMLSLMYPIYRHRPWLLIRTLIIVIITSTLLFFYNSDSGLSKSIMNIGTELAIGDYSDLSDMNNKFRGWETYQAFVTFGDGNFFQIVFGHGAGKMVDLGTYLFFADEYRRYIPVLHNGYMYALVKTGIAGILCYLFYFIYILRFAIKKIKLSNIQQNIEPLLLIGTLISIYISNIVISSLYNPSVGLLGVMCGALFYYLTNSDSDRVILYHKKL